MKNTRLGVGGVLSHASRLLGLGALGTLTACAPIFAATTSLEQQINGTYQGESVSLFGRTPYRLVLSVQQTEGQASGVLTNLNTKKIYALNGEMSYSTEEVKETKKSTQSNQSAQIIQSVPKMQKIVKLKLKMYEKGNSHNGNLRAEIRGEQLSGQMSGLIFGHEWYSLNLHLKKINTLNTLNTSDHATPDIKTKSVPAPPLAPRPTPQAP